MQLQGRRPGDNRILQALLLVVLTVSVLAHTGSAVSNVASGRVIDVFTQKAPFDGKGLYESSDAFEPQELVILYAIVTYNDYPVALKLVSFQAEGPPNSLENITVTGSATTNDSGIAEFSFRIPWPSSDPQVKVFGEWRVLATASIADQTVVDVLTFQVGWIIRIISIAILNTDFEAQIEFPRQAPIGFAVVVENIARVPKVGTITFDAIDALQDPIIHMQKENILFQPGQTNLHASSQIPINATIGQATAWASAYTAPVDQGGTLYSPPVFATFEIMSYASVRDVAITDVTPSKTGVLRGETLQITVTSRNKGDETETFSITLYYDNVAIGTKRIFSLTPGAEAQLVFRWNTSDVHTGKYVIRAVADTIEGETNAEDNTFVDGIVTIESLFNRVARALTVIFALIIMLVVTASLFLLFLLYHSRRRRRRKKQPEPYFTITSRPHI